MRARWPPAAESEQPREMQRRELGTEQEHLHDLLEHDLERLHNAPLLDFSALVERDLFAAGATVTRLKHDNRGWTTPEIYDASLGASVLPFRPRLLFHETSERRRD